MQDRFADARARPPVDSQQDWNLVAGKEENGWTIMAFNRALQTGDARDRDIVEVRATYTDQIDSGVSMHRLHCMHDLNGAQHLNGC